MRSSLPFRLLRHFVKSNYLASMTEGQPRVKFIYTKVLEETPGGARFSTHYLQNWGGTLNANDPLSLVIKD